MTNKRCILSLHFFTVIWAAYSKVNPQLAANKSANLSDWGTGNSASNQLYFLSTQNSASDICSAESQTPEGTYRIQDVSSGKYVSLANNNQLTATTTADVLGSKFQLAFIPGGGTIQALSNNQYVTASPDGNSVLTAARDNAQGYEKFRWNRQSDGTYILIAMVNKQRVGTATNGQLFNNGTVSSYRLIPVDNSAPAAIPAQGTLKNSKNGNYVVSSSANPTLMATTSTAGAATKWSFERIAGSPDNAPKYAIKSLTTNQYVTANSDGSSPLSAARNSPQGWEYFQITAYQGGYIILHDVNGYPVTIRSDGTVIDKTDNSNVDSASIWTIQ